MSVSIEDCRERFAEQADGIGCCGSVGEAAREVKLKALRATLDASIAIGGEVTEGELDQAIAARSRDLIRKGISP